jgi:hypothetical protein
LERESGTVKKVTVVFDDGTSLEFLNIGETVGVWKGNYQLCAYGKLTDKYEDVIPPAPPIPGGIPAGDYAPTAITMVRGAVVEGTVASLASTDGNLLKVAGAEWLPQYPGYFTVEYLVDIALPGFVAPDFKASMVFNYTGTPTYVYLLNQATHAWIMMNFGMSRANAPAPAGNNVNDFFLDGSAHFKVYSYRQGAGYVNEFDSLKLSIS